MSQKLLLSLQKQQDQISCVLRVPLLRCAGVWAQAAACIGLQLMKLCF